MALDGGLWVRPWDGCAGDDAGGCKQDGDGGGELHLCRSGQEKYKI